MPGIRALRRVLPGDSKFGDPLSTAGTGPTQVLARRGRVAGDGPFSAVRELGLAILQVADWLSPGSGGIRSPVAIAFTDLVGFSSWALRAGDEKSLDLLRSADALVTAAFEAHGGVVVKRLGDGTMAVFDKPAAAAEASRDAIRAVSRLKENDYRPRLRAGVHFGRAHVIGGDYLGVDVNIAARLCEAAGAEQVLVSGAARNDLDRPRLRAAPERGRLPGVPRDLEIYAFRDD
jgi:adenylate cyclase